MPNGFQDHWLAGSRFYFKRDAVDSVDQPFIDFGVINPVNPDFQPEEVELKDSDGGVNTLVESSITDIEETYEVTCKNLSMQNFAMAFLSDPVAAFTQTAQTNRIEHDVPMVGHLVKLTDGTVANDYVYDVRVAGVTSAQFAAGVLSAEQVDAIDSSANTITTNSDISTHLTAGDWIILEGTGLTGDDLANVGSYKVSSVSTVTITLDSTTPLATTNASFVGSLIYANNTDTGEVLEPGLDWELVSDPRGIIRTLTTGSITNGDDVGVVFWSNAITGNRLLNPQAGSSDIKGEGLFIWGRKNFTEETAREARVSITPSSSNIQIDDYSEIVFTIKVLSDVNVTNSAGRMLHYLGDVPDLS